MTFNKEAIEPWLIGTFLGIIMIPISKFILEWKKYKIDLQKLKIEQCVKIFADIGDIEKSKTKFINDTKLYYEKIKNNSITEQDIQEYCEIVDKFFTQISLVCNAVNQKIALKTDVITDIVYFITKHKYNLKENQIIDCYHGLNKGFRLIKRDEIKQIYLTKYSSIFDYYLYTLPLWRRICGKLLPSILNIKSINL